MNDPAGTAMKNAIAVLNAGSSSLKFSVFVERGEAFQQLVGDLTVLGEHTRFENFATAGTY